MDSIVVVQILMGALSILAAGFTGYVTLKIKPLQAENIRLAERVTKAETNIESNRNSMFKKLESISTMITDNHAEQLNAINNMNTWTRDQDYVKTSEMESYVKDQMRILSAESSNSRHE